VLEVALSVTWTLDTRRRCSCCVGAFLRGGEFIGVSEAESARGFVAFVGASSSTVDNSSSSSLVTPSSTEEVIFLFFGNREVSVRG
jgi:hypothetical protein